MKKRFKEKQYFSDRMTYIFLGSVLIASIIGLVKSAFFQAGSTANMIMCLAIAISCIVGLLWFQRLRLNLSINSKRIKYKFFPLHKKAKRILWEDVESCRIVRTSGISQWYGGNVRFAKEAWYSLTGRNGLSIRTKDGKHLFIGCNDIDQLAFSLEGLLDENDL